MTVLKSDWVDLDATAEVHAAAHNDLANAVDPIHTGSGSPEGVVTAPVGHLYLRTSGAAGTMLYQKVTGTGNTGWQAIAVQAYTPVGGLSSFPPAATPLLTDSYNRTNAVSGLGAPDRNDLTYVYGMMGTAAASTHLPGISSNKLYLPSDGVVDNGHRAKLHFGYADQKITFTTETLDSVTTYFRTGLTTFGAVAFSISIMNDNSATYYMPTVLPTLYGPNGANVTTLSTFCFQEVLGTLPNLPAGPFTWEMSITGTGVTAIVQVKCNGTTARDSTTMGGGNSLANGCIDTNAFMLNPNVLATGLYVTAPSPDSPGGGTRVDDLNFVYPFIGDTFRSSIAGTSTGGSTTVLGKPTTGLPSNAAWTAFTAGSPGVQTTTGAGIHTTIANGVRVGAWIECVNADGVLSLEWNVTTADHMFLMFRRSDDANYWYATTTQLFQRVADSNTLVGTFTAPIVVADRMTIVLYGSSIDVRRNGVSVLSVSDSFNSTATKHGLAGDGTGTTNATRVGNWQFIKAS
jgi:hypothetical protein